MIAPTAALAVSGGTACVQPTQTFGAGAQGSYVVPAGVYAVAVGAAGAPGAAANSTSYSAAGGAGAAVSTTLSVTPGEVLDYAVGTTNGISGGLSGSAPSGGSGASQGPYAAGGGGGASFIRNAGTVLVAAGAGGGGGYGSSAAGGDAGPGTATSTSGVFNGGDGRKVYGGYSVPTGGSSVPGTGAGAGAYGGAGSSGSGSVGGNAAFNTAAGGGGGGFMGGGGGAYGQGFPSSGGAGSSFVATAYTIVANYGSGSVTFPATADPLFQSVTGATFGGGVNSPFTVCAPGGPPTTLTESGTLPDGVSFVDNGDGTGTLTGAATQIGEFPLHFTSTSPGGTESQDFTLTVNDITAKTLEVTATPAGITAGDSVQVTVTAYDAQHDVATTDGDTVDLSSSDLGANMPSTAVLVNGTATFTAQLTTSGAQTVTVNDLAAEGPISGTSDDVTVTPGIASSLGVVMPDPETAGQSVSAVITARDNYGNIDTNDTATVHLTSTDPAAVLPADFALTAGSATVPVTFKTAGTQLLTANAPGVGGDSGLVTVTAADTDSLVLTTPASVVASSNNWVQVAPQDAYGNSTTTSDVLHFTSTDPHAVLPADAAWGSVPGGFDATFKTAGTQTITVTDVTNPAVHLGSQDVTVTAGDAQQLVTHTGDLQSARAGHGFTAPLSVLVTDADGNPVAGQQVDFAVPADSGSAFGGSVTTSAVSDSHGIATASPLTAGPTAGPLTVTATSISSGTPVLGSTSFTETITASDAELAAIPITSKGIGTAPQSGTAHATAGGSVTLLDGLHQPVNEVVTPQGTYVLDPASGVITFVAVTGFSGTATPVTYQLTDAYNLQATSTYTPTVTAPAPVLPPVKPLPVGTARVRTAGHLVLTGSSFSATCTLSAPSIKTCRTSIAAHVSGRQVVVGTSATVKALRGAKSVKTVVRLTALGRALAAQVGGVKVTVSALVVKPDGHKLAAKALADIVNKHVVVAKPALFPTKVTTLTATAKHDLAALKARRGAVKIVTCVGYTDSVGNATANLALGKARAKAVCAALAGYGVKLVVVSRGNAHPVGDNATAAGRALNRRVEISFTY